MASELPRADSTPLEDDRDSTYSGPHPLRTESRSGRPSSRPSAFGPPRISPSAPPPSPSVGEQGAGSDTPPQTSELRLKRDPVITEKPESRQAPASSAPPIPRSRRSITTDIEQLLPISHAIKSLPRPPRMPTTETVEPSARRLPWASIGVFVCALAASVGSLVHYATVGQPLPDGPLDLAEIAVTPLRAPSAKAASGATAADDGTLVVRPSPELPGERDEARARAALRSLVGASWAMSDHARDPVLEEAHHALAVGDDHLAEALYRELGTLYPAPTAFGLAQVRLAQGEREAAEGWILSAITHGPQEPRYRELYADILGGAGRHDEAGFERALARSLRKRATHTQR